MIDKLISWDEEIFLKLNSIHADWIDPVANIISGNVVWIPLYIILIYFIYQTDAKEIWWVLGGIALTILMADQFTSGFMKPYFERLRPCHDPRWVEIVHTYKRCGGLYGFASSHAANTFGVAIFLNLKMNGKIRYLTFLFLWASVVSYSRIYLGVHYPLDILVGGMVGLIAGFISWILIVFIRREIFKFILR
jgi:undecaprenyl-diphosphatase